MPTSPLERNPVTPPSVVTGQGGARPHGNDGALGRLGGWCFDHSRTTLGLWAALLVVVFTADLTINNEQEWTFKS